MKWHLVGGFLGSGKTTTITRAAKKLIQQGLRVGIVTNDQGATLVDSAFAKSLDLPTVEVTGGCFCCHYDDLENQLLNLRDTVAPDVIFAESVGSCADIVSTVIKPYQQLSDVGIHLNSFSVLADIRLLRRYLNNQPLPFSDNVIYIFEKQLEEANLLIINKRDLVDDATADAVRQQTIERFSDKQVLLHSANNDDDIDNWLQQIQQSDGVTNCESVDIDYDRYTDGECQLAWMNEIVRFSIGRSSGKEAITYFLDRLIHYVKQVPIGHLKVFVTDGTHHVKLSLIEDMPDGGNTEIPDFSEKIECMINARVESSIRELEHFIDLALVDVMLNMSDVTYTRAHYQGFHPAPPVPTHRM